MTPNCRARTNTHHMRPARLTTESRSLRRLASPGLRNSRAAPIYNHMSARDGRARNACRRGEIEITDAAIGGFRHLLREVRGKLETHASGDGGLICEDRTVRMRPTIWRISPDGAVLPDSPYNFRRRAFISAELPPGFQQS
jgi:hypothetical protein